MLDGVKMEDNVGLKLSRLLYCMLVVYGKYRVKQNFANEKKTPPQANYLQYRMTRKKLKAFII